MDQKEMAGKKLLFIEGFSETAVIATGLRRAGITRKQQSAWARNDPVFLDDCQNAYLDATDRAEEELRTRSVEGVEEIQTFKGEIIYARDFKGELKHDSLGQKIPFTRRVVSDRLLEVYMKAHKPGYREPKGGGDTVYIDPIPKAIQDIKKGGDANEGLKVTYVLPEGKSKAHYDAMRNTSDIVDVEAIDPEIEDMLS